MIVLQGNLKPEGFRDERVQDLIDVPFTFLDLLPFQDTLEYPKEIFPYGSTKFIKLTKQATHNFYREESKPSNWLHPYILNQPNVLFLEEFKKRTDLDTRVFLRPNKDLKDFPGGVKTVEEHIVVIDTHQHNKVFGDIEVQVSTPVNIFEERRYFIVEGKVVQGSVYRKEGRIFLLRTTEEENRLAQDVADMWLPIENIVMDLALTEEGWKVIEFNCINCSGLYDVDAKKLFRRIYEAFFL